MVGAYKYTQSPWAKSHGADEVVWSFDTLISFRNRKEFGRRTYLMEQRWDRGMDGLREEGEKTMAWHPRGMDAAPNDGDDDGERRRGRRLVRLVSGSFFCFGAARSWLAALSSARSVGYPNLKPILICSFPKKKISTCSYFFAITLVICKVAMLSFLLWSFEMRLGENSLYSNS